MKNICCLLIFLFLSVCLAACDHGSRNQQKVGFVRDSVKLADVPKDCAVGDASFSPLGQGVVITVAKDNKQTIYAGSESGAFYDSIRDLLFSESGTSYAYIAVNNGKEHVVVNKEEGTAYDSIGKIIFAPGGRIVYEAMASGKWQVVSDKKVSESFDGIMSPPVVTSDGKRISYIARHSGSQKSNLVICNSDLDDCWTGNAYDALSPIRTDLSGFHLSYIATKGKKQGVITVNLQESGLKETESNWYDKIQSFEISEGGGYLAFLATQGEQDLLVKNGAETRVPHYDSAFDIAVSKQGQVIYTAMVKNSVRAYLDGRRVGSDYAEINAPVFSPDGGNYAYVVKKGEKYAVAVNGKEGPSFDMAVEPRFSPDGSRVVYRARNRGERFVVVGDTKAQTVKEHPHYEAVWRVNFAPDGKSVAYGVKMGQQFWWKHENL